MGKFETGIVEQYLSDLHDIHSRGVGTKETSYYTPLANLLNEVGKTLKPKIHCIMHPASRGAGIPDGGLFGKSGSVGLLENPTLGQRRGLTRKWPSATAAVASLELTTFGPLGPL